MGRGRARFAAFTGAIALVVSVALQLPGFLSPSEASLVTPNSAFAGPDAIASDSSHVWVTNGGNNSVTELDASTGSVVQVLEGSKYDFKYPVTGMPVAIADDGEHVWVADDGGAVTELKASTGALVRVEKEKTDNLEGICSDRTHVWDQNPINGDLLEFRASTGRLVRVVKGAKYKFNPNEGGGAEQGIDCSRSHLWVTNPAGNAIAEFQVATGALVRIIKGSKFGFQYPDAVVSDGTHVWVASHGIRVGSLTELNASTGALVNLIKWPGSVPEHAVGHAVALALDSTHIWVLNDESVTELSTSGALVQEIDDPSYGLIYPTAITSDGTDVWVANTDGNSVTELNASTGELVRVLS